MISPEKNDVDISKLFNWNKKASIFGVDGIEKFDVYIRIVGDADWNRARVKALRASRELRQKFHDKNSDEYLAYIPIKEDVDKDSIIKMMLVLDMSNIRDTVIKNLNIPFPKEPSEDATLEEQENYQIELDNFEESRRKKIIEEFEKLSEKKEKEFKKVTFDELFNEYVKNLINSLCSEELNKIFLEYTTFYGVYKDEDFNERYFKSFDEFNNLPTAIKSQLMQEYMNLDVKIYNLKK